MTTPKTDLPGPGIFTPEYYARMRENEAGGWWNAGMRDIAGRLLNSLVLAPHGTLVDIGCGSGQTMEWFRQRHPGWTTTGLDVAMDGLRAARASGQAITHASALALPLPTASADLLITLDVLQHLPLHGGDREALTEMHRVLRPGGYLLARTNAQAFPRTPDDPAYDFHKYEPHELRAKLEAAGFEIHVLSRVNALLGLIEIPRELRATRRHGAGYHGILTRTRRRRVLDAVCRTWLSLEGRVIEHGIGLPMGRTILALCRRPPSQDAYRHTHRSAPRKEQG